MRKTRLTLAAAVATALLVAGPANAQTDTTSITLNGGTLSFTQQPLAADFPAANLTGLTQVSSTSMNDWRVADLRGSGAGWNVTFQASQFSTGGATPSTLPTGSLKLVAPVVAATDIVNNLSVPPVIQPGTPYTLDGASAVSVVKALALTGQGEWTFDHTNAADLLLTIPANANAGTYTSNLTFTLGATP